MEEKSAARLLYYFISFKKMKGRRLPTLPLALSHYLASTFLRHLLHVWLIPLDDTKEVKRAAWNLLACAATLARSGRLPR